VARAGPKRDRDTAVERTRLCRRLCRHGARVLSAGPRGRHCVTGVRVRSRRGRGSARIPGRVENVHADKTSSFIYSSVRPEDVEPNARSKGGTVETLERGPRIVNSAP